MQLRLALVGVEGTIAGSLDAMAPHPLPFSGGQHAPVYEPYGQSRYEGDDQSVSDNQSFGHMRFLGDQAPSGSSSPEVCLECADRN